MTNTFLLEYNASYLRLVNQTAANFPAYIRIIPDSDLRQRREFIIAFFSDPTRILCQFLETVYDFCLPNPFEFAIHTRKYATLHNYQDFAPKMERTCIFSYSKFPLQHRVIA
jgi:hypothetical protein